MSDNDLAKSGLGNYPWFLVIWFNWKIIDRNVKSVGDLTELGRLLFSMIHLDMKK